jgi:hypothetical protein
MGTAKLPPSSAKLCAQAKLGPVFRVAVGESII